MHVQEGNYLVLFGSQAVPGSRGDLWSGWWRIYKTAEVPSAADAPVAIGASRVFLSSADAASIQGREDGRFAARVQAAA